MYLVLLVVAIFAVGSWGQKFNRFCHYNSWSLSRNPEHGLIPEDIDPFLCTHIILGFAEIDETGLRLKDPNHYQQEYLYQRIVRLRRINPRLNMILSVGGWDKSQEGYSKLVSSRENILFFTKWIITYLRRHDFDGLDLDWEYPTFKGSPMADRKKFVDLVENLAYEFDIEEIPDIKWKLTLTWTADPLEPIRTSAYDIKGIASKVHFVNLKMYDFHGHWDDPLQVNHHSPLTNPSSPRNVNELAKTWVKAGVRIEKLILGIPFFGRSFTLKTANMSMPGSPAVGPGSDYGDGIPIHNLCHIIRGGTKELYLPEKKVPYIVSGSEWIGYDNPRSVMEKAQLVFNNALAGVMIYSLDMDDHRGTCGQKYPMMMAVIHGLNAYMEYIDSKHKSLELTYNKKILRARVSLRNYRRRNQPDKVAEVQQRIRQIEQEQQQAMGNMVYERQQAQAMLNRGVSLPPIEQQSWSW
ncbi:hypothetical protein FSP39_016448 [Pinctada imbricata]|uniref:GH18 domain-containing protein n=1 Tax=Pinctada imbricata TaxID=66713 RepID=A0AA88XZB2_PINIB|nr:hypothetical protein FSP39_016448 [Pinctada imbricata]